MTGVAELVLDGMLVSAATPIQLAPGWRWLGYLRPGRCR